MVYLHLLSTMQTVIEKGEIVPENVSQGQTMSAHKTCPATYSVMQFIEIKKKKEVIIL